MKSAIASSASSHSGWAMTRAAGWRSLRPTSFRWLKVSWTMQVPCQSTMGRPIFFSQVAPRFLSGANRMVLSAGMLRTIFSAFDDVTM